MSGNLPLYGFPYSVIPPYLSGDNGIKGNPLDASRDPYGFKRSGSMTLALGIRKEYDYNRILPYNNYLKASVRNYYLITTQYFKQYLNTQEGKGNYELQNLVGSLYINDIRFANPGANPLPNIELAIDCFEKATNQAPQFDPASRNLQYYMNLLEAFQPGNLSNVNSRPFETLSLKRSQTVEEAKKLIKDFLLGQSGNALWPELLWNKLNQSQISFSDFYIEKTDILNFTETFSERLNAQNYEKLNSSHQPKTTIILSNKLAFSDPAVVASYLLDSLTRLMHENGNSVYSAQDSAAVMSYFWKEHHNRLKKSNSLNRLFGWSSEPKEHIEEPTLDSNLHFFNQGSSVLDRMVRYTYFLNGPPPLERLPSPKTNLFDHIQFKLQKMRWKFYTIPQRLLSSTTVKFSSQPPILSFDSQAKISSSNDTIGPSDAMLAVGVLTPSLLLGKKLKNILGTQCTKSINKIFGSQKTQQRKFKNTFVVELKQTPENKGPVSEINKIHIWMKNNFE